VETANPIQAALVNANLIESSLPDAGLRLSFAMVAAVS
jgi:hypothetical protein